MMNFIQPGCLGSRPAFISLFQRPINAGQTKDASIEQVEKARRRVFLLQKALQRYVLRRGTDVLERSLPPRHEFVVYCSLSPVQSDVYSAFLDFRERCAASSVSVEMLTAYNDLKLLFNHPDILRDRMVRVLLSHKSGSGGKGEEEDAEEDEDEDDSDWDDGGVLSRKKKKRKSTKRKTSLSRSSSSSSSSVPVWKDPNRFSASVQVSGYMLNHLPTRYSWATSLLSQSYEPMQLVHGSKFVVLFSILHHSYKVRDKVVVFSRSLPSL